MYCETIRLGSIADADRTQQSQINPAKAHSSDPRRAGRPLREVLKFINYDLTVVLERILVARHGVEE